MARLLFDTPWWIPTILAGLGAFFFWTGNQRQEKNVRTSGLGMILAAVLVVVLSIFIDTDLEKAVKASKALVGSVEQRDWTALSNILAPSTSLGVFNGHEVYANRSEIIAGAQKAVDQYGLKNVRILSTTPQESEDLIGVTMTIMSEQDFTQGRPITTSWKMEWQRSGKTWVLIRITCISIGNMSGEGAERQFPRLR